MSFCLAGKLFWSYGAGISKSVLQVFRLDANSFYWQFILKARCRRYDAVWEFYKWIAHPEVAAQWHKDTGYFLSSTLAEKLLKDEGWFESNSNFFTAFDQILSGKRFPVSQGILLGEFS